MNESPPGDKAPPAGLGGTVAGEASHLVQSVEVIVEHAVEAAERSLAARLGAGGMRVFEWALRALLWLALAVYVVFCLTLIGLRLWWMPHIDDWRGQIESRATETLKQRVTIGRIESGWQGFNPRLQLTDVQLHDDSGTVTLTLPQIDAVLSWTSIPTLQARVKSLIVLAPEIEVRRLSESRFKLAGMLIDLDASDSNTAALEWLLQQHHVAVNQATVHYFDQTDPAAPPGPIDLTEVDVLLTRGLGAHYFGLRARPPSAIADVVDIRGWFDHPWSQPISRIRSWSGRLYARLDYVDMARLEKIARQIPEPFHLQRGNGAIRAWIDFNALAVQRARADLAFTDVDLKLRSDLRPLRLTSLQGRITQQAWNTGTTQGQDITLSQLTLEGPGGLHLPPTDLSYRVSHGAGASATALHNEVGASALSLADLSALASHLPLPAQTQELISRYSMRGTLADLHASWDEDADKFAPIALKTRFSHLSAAAQPAEPPLDPEGRLRAGTPGFENLTGSIDVTRSGGTLTLATTDARLILPGVLDDPAVPVGRLDARIHWSSGASNGGSSGGSKGGALELGVDSLAFGNDDVEFSVAGTYRYTDAAGAWAELNGSLSRAKAASLGRYVPNFGGSGTRDWLRVALRDGQLSGGSFLLRGKLDQFPFVAQDSGDFQASLHVSGAVLDYAPSTPTHIRPKAWPVMTGVEADLKFSRNILDIRGTQATVHGVRLSAVQGRIGPLDSHEVRLAISGQGNGELSDLVGYVNDSPVGTLIGGFLASTQSTGPARLQVKLDIPLNHAVDTDVAGAVSFVGNDIVLRDDIAPLTAVTGRLDFTQHGVHVSGLNAGYVGGQAHIDVDSSPDGAVKVKVAGGATPHGLRRQIESGVVRRILDSARGQTKYSATLTVHAKAMELHAVSDLTGLAIDLPEPVGKLAADAMPLRVDLVPAIGAVPLRDSVLVSAGNLISVQLERTAAGPADPTMHIMRGVIGVGAASDLPESGLLVNLSLPRLDVDRWLPVLDASAAEPSGGAGGSGVPDLVAARVDELTISGKPLHNVVLGASRAADGGWNINLDAVQTSGSLHWMSGTHGGQGRLTARLAHLTIPESAREPVAEVLDAPARELPELDVIAEDFVLGTSRLGRLELDAQNAGNGRNNSWQVKRLLIDDPEGRITGSGQWTREPGSQNRRMSLAVTLDVVNAGNLLARFGTPGAIKNGSGKVTCSLSWLGSPFSIDYPSLSGDLHLNIDKGQFLKAEPGVARLLGVMSLQSLPRRITLDFRDIFSQGFAFDTIRASAQISKGVLTTHDLKMAGVDASVLIEGEVDLQAESQNLHVLVLPEIRADSASVALFIANPAVGIGTFLAQWVLRHPLSKIFSYEYDLTGSWAEPQVKRHERPKPEPYASPTG